LLQNHDGFGHRLASLLASAQTEADGF